MKKGRRGEGELHSPSHISGSKSNSNVLTLEFNYNKIARQMTFNR